MRIDAIEKYFKLAIEDLYERDGYLLENGHNIHEQAISHRLAVYLERRFAYYAPYKILGLSVDCEYNKNKENLKTVYKACGSNCRYSTIRCFIKECQENIMIRSEGENIIYDNAYDFVCHYGADGKSSRPDILVHKRGENKPTNNLIVEVKKQNNIDENDKRIDKIKLSYFTCKEPNSEYQYQIGYYVECGENKANILRFIRGRIHGALHFDATTRQWSSTDD